MAEEAVIDLTLKTGEAEKRAQSLKSELRQMKEQLASMKEGTAEFNALAKEAGKLEDKIGDVNARVKALSSDTSKLDAFISVSQGIAGGFAAAQGAAALFGQENEDLNKTLLKVQGSIALLNGVQQVANTLNKESAFMINTMTFLQGRYNAVVEGTTGVLKVLRIVGASLGIGLLVTALGLLIANFDKVTAAVRNVINNFEPLKIVTEQLGKAYEYVTGKLRDFLSNFGLMDSVAEHQAKLLNEKTVEDLQRVVKAKEEEIALRKALGQDVYDLEQELFDARIELAKAKGEEHTQILAEQLTAIRQNRKAEAAAELAAEKKRLEDLERARKKFQEAKDKQAKIEEEIAQMRRKEQDAQRIAQEQEVQRQLDEAAAHARQAQDAYERQRDTDLRKAKDRAAARVAVEQGVYSATSSLVSAIGQLGKKNETLQKSLAIVQIAIDTAKAISGAVAQAQSVPYPGNILAIVSGVAAVLANIAAAKQILSKDAGVSAGSNPTISAAAPASTNNVAPSLPQSPQSIPIPQQVYVTETDITGVQQQVNVIEGLAKIG